MYISKISYRRTFYLGNDEFETIELTADLNAEDNFSESMEKLKVMVHNQSMDALMQTNAHVNVYYDCDENEKPKTVSTNS